MTKKLLICLTLFLILEGSFSQKSDDPLEWMLFSDIPEVVIAAKKKESLVSASGTVYVITDKEIERYGWRDIKEILRAVPNIDTCWTWSWLWGGQRGFVGNFAGTLLMIDGREVQNLLASEAFITNNFPAHRIKRVEILQGPSSTLYGGNTTQGVINIVTKYGQEGDQDVSHVGLIYGQADTQEIHGVFKKKFVNSELGFSASYLRTDQDWDELAEFWVDGDRFSRNPSYEQYATNNKDIFRNREFAWTVDAYFKYKNFYIGYDYFAFQNDFGIEFLQYDTSGFEDTRATHLFYIGYKHEFSDNFDVTAEFQHILESDLWAFQSEVNMSQWTSYNDIQLMTRAESIEETKRPLIKIQANYSIGDKHYIIAGYDWSRLDMDHLLVEFNTFYPNRLNSNIPDYWPLNREETTKHSIFIQDVYKMTENIKITAGVRFNAQDHTNDSWLPRASLIYLFSENAAVKLNYGTAFRPPNIFEYINVIDDEIDSQEMEMFELNYTHNFNVGEFEVSNIMAAYQMEATNLYNRVLVPELSSENLAAWKTVVGGSYEVSGFEDMLKFSKENFSGMFGFRWIDPDSNTDIPDYRVLLGLSYDFFEKVHASLFGEYTPEVEADDLNGIYKIDSQFQLDLNIILGQFELDEFSGSLGLYIKNIFDEEIYHANVRGNSPVQFMQYPRHIRLKSSVKF